MPTLTEKKVKPKASVVSNHLTLYNHWTSFDSLSVLSKQKRIIWVQGNSTKDTLKAFDDFKNKKKVFEVMFF